MPNSSADHNGDYGHWVVAQEGEARCEAPGCIRKPVEGTRFCQTHGGNSLINSNTRAEKFKYQLGKYQARYSQFRTDPEIKTLRDEIGVARMLLEETFNLLQAAGQEDKLTLLTLMPTMTKQLELIRSLVGECDKIETKLGVTLDRQTVLNIGVNIVQIVGKHISDEAVLEALADDIQLAITGPLGDPG